MNLVPPKIYGLIGYPVKHSFSPVMHNAAFGYLGINAEYRLFPIKPEELEAFFLSDIMIKDISGNKVATKDILGFNVTLPYKEKVLDFVSLDSQSDYLKQLRTVNTIIRKEGGYQGFNTDISGFQWHLTKKNFFDPQGKQVALLGAGGAAKAAIYVLAKLGASSIVIFDIDKQKAQNLVSLINGLFPQMQISWVETIEQLNIPQKNLLINATPVGLKPTDPCLVKPELLRKELFVYDLIYNPLQTKLLSLAKQAGALVSNGLGMLQYQGALSFQYFTAEQAPIDKIFKVMGEALRQEINKL
ncbi:MAG: shikimate dehydrogenase [Candidatus Omnitrophota bacterium]|jgi:shikimate dehydrogenase